MHKDMNPKGAKTFSKVIKSWWLASSLGSKRLGKGLGGNLVGRGRKRKGEEWRQRDRRRR